MNKTKAKIKKVMHEYKEGKLHSGSKKGPKVTNPKQAVAIAYSEAKKIKKDPKKKHDHKPTIKKDGYAMHDTDEVREMMEEHMHDAAKIKRHPHKDMIKAEGCDMSSTGSQRPKRHNKETDLNHGKKKRADEPFSVEAEYDAIKSFKRAGLDKNTGADDNKEDVKYARKMKIGAKNKRK